ncbi:hypothetical protein [Belnapia rosea]|uniref:hypothetical protein n=1 Tax=Belnapia rosea TaxID=938405 RepID=UPI00088797FD|nr:hypothetical protein [Belnapia rosea]SDB61839.1 hypothetical protein SAMN02927895_02543 [Belnapia rosea]
MPETSEPTPPEQPAAELCPFTIPAPPRHPISSRRIAPEPVVEPRPATLRNTEDEIDLRDFALALALVFAPAAILLSFAILPGP